MYAANGEVRRDNNQYEYIMWKFLQHVQVNDIRSYRSIIG